MHGVRGRNIRRGKLDGMHGVSTELDIACLQHFDQRLRRHPGVHRVRRRPVSAVCCRNIQDSGRQSDMHELRRRHVFHIGRCDRGRSMHQLRRRHVFSCQRDINMHELRRGQVVIDVGRKLRLLLRRLCTRLDLARWKLEHRRLRRQRRVYGPGSYH